MTWNTSSLIPSPAPDSHVFVSPHSHPIVPEVNETCLEAGQTIGDHLLFADRTLHECACASYNITTSDFRRWRCSQFGPPIIKTSFDVVILVTYILIMVVSLVGNSLVCYIVLSSARMRTVTNYLITSMAVGDLLMTLLCVPFTFSSVLLLQHWPFGATMCWLVSFAQAVTVFVSAFSLIAISLDRYRAIIYPLRPRVTRQHARLFILLIWLLAAGTCVPIGVTSRVWQPPHRRFILNDLHVCDEHWERGSREQYSLAVMVLQYFLPVLVLMYTYGRIALEIWSKTAALFEQRDPREARLARARRKVILMMVVCVAAFTLAWLPFHVFELTTQHYPAVLQWPFVRELFWGVHAVAMSHCCMNPVIYFTMNDKFRERLHQALGRRRMRSARYPSGGRENSRLTLECQQMNRMNGTSARSSYLNSVKCDTSAV